MSLKYSIMELITGHCVLHKGDIIFKSNDLEECKKRVDALHNYELNVCEFVEHKLDDLFKKIYNFDLFSNDDFIKNKNNVPKYKQIINDKIRVLHELYYTIYCYVKKKNWSRNTKTFADFLFSIQRQATKIEFTLRFMLFGYPDKFEHIFSKVFVDQDEKNARHLLDLLCTKFIHIEILSSNTPPTIRYNMLDYEYDDEQDDY